MRRRVSKDANHDDIVQALRSAGVQVLDTHAFPDFVDLVTYVPPPQDKYRLVEIKNPKRKVKAGQTYLTDSQKNLMRTMPLVIVESVEEALQAHGVAS